MVVGSLRILLIAFGYCLLAIAVRPSTQENEETNAAKGRAAALLEQNESRGRAEGAEIIGEHEATLGQEVDNNVTAASSGAWCHEFGAKHSGWHWWTDCKCDEDFALISLPGKKCNKALHRIFSYKLNPKECQCRKMKTVCHVVQPVDHGQSHEKEMHFDAGHTGLVISSEDGKVMKAPSRESQGGTRGVGADWQILEIDGEPFSEGLLHQESTNEVCTRVDYQGRENHVACKAMSVDKSTTIKFKVTPLKYCRAPENIKKARTEPQEGEPQLNYKVFLTRDSGKCSLHCKDLNLILTDADGKDRSIGSNHWRSKSSSGSSDYDLDDY